MDATEHKNTQETTSKSSGFDAEYIAEIDEAVRASCEREKMTEEEKPSAEEVLEKVAEETVESTGTDTDTDTDTVEADDGAITLDDADVERAVKAGMSIKAARSFADKGTFDEVVSLLESKTESQVGVSDGEVPAEVTDDDFFIPDWEDEGEFDPSLVSQLKALKSVINKQSKIISSFKAGGESLDDKDWFDSKLESLGSEYKDTLGVGVKKPLAMHLKTRDEVKAKFDILNAGYKQANQKVAAEDVLNEALRVVVGDVSSIASDAVKANALRDRNRLSLQRPSASQGRGGAKQSAENIEREIAEELDAKFFGK